MADAQTVLRDVRNILSNKTYSPAGKVTRIHKATQPAATPVPPDPTPVPPDPTPVPPDPTPAPTAGSLFAPTSYVNTRKGNAPVDPDSGAVVAKLVQAAKQAWVSMDSGSCAFYVVPPDTPRKKVVHTTPGGTGKNIQAALDAKGGVPIPPGGITTEITRSGGGWSKDGHVAIVCGDDYYELYQLQQEAGQWKASTAGCIEGVSKHMGVFLDGQGWPAGPSYHTWGDTGSSIPVMAGTILISEWQQAMKDDDANPGSGFIPHELALDLNPQFVRAGWVWPAQRTDGNSGDASMPMEGDCFQLDPAFDVKSLSKQCQRIMARTLQLYGTRLRDRTGVLGLYMEDPYVHGHDGGWVVNTLFKGQWPGTNPGGWLQPDGGFPWDKTRLLKRCPRQTDDSKPTLPC